jgi:hypothetical protein
MHIDTDSQTHGHTGPHTDTDAQTPGHGQTDPDSDTRHGTAALRLTGPRVRFRAQERRLLGAAEAAGLRVVRRRDVVAKAGRPPLLGLFVLADARHLPGAGPPDQVRRRLLLVWRWQGAAVAGAGGGDGWTATYGMR